MRSLPSEYFGNVAFGSPLHPGLVKESVGCLQVHGLVEGGSFPHLHLVGEFDFC